MAGFAILLGLVLSGAEAAYSHLYTNRIFPGARIFDVRLNGLNKSEARQVVQTAIDAALAKGLRFKYRGHEIILDATTVSTDPDVARDLVRYNFDQALERAFALGRTGSWRERVAQQIRLRAAPLNVPAIVMLDRVQITDALQTALRRELASVKDARFVIDASTHPPSVRLEQEQSGFSLVLEPALNDLLWQVEHLDFRPIQLSDQIVQPRLKRTDLEPLLSRARTWANRPLPTFIYETQKFIVPAAIFFQWIAVTGTRPDLQLTVNSQIFTRDLKRLAANLEQEAKNGNLVVQAGKIVSFTAGTEGRQIDVSAALEEVLAHWPASSTFPLIVRKTYGRLVGTDPETLGIREILGVGKSNFSGSPVNRRKNIAHGVALVNGSIIQPGQIFSLVQTLGPVDEAHNWLPELVIKGNVTKPEYGGGLCQIGTTTFRAALVSGLPIVERQNHSYRVRYYEPAGTDATIYGPKPDFRFLNDTQHPVLINAYITGDEAFFEFWGTKDGRNVEQTKSTISNVTPPPSMKLVETLELPPGKKKCTEVAHTGADASFIYTVKYPSGEVKKTVFRSHYRPWQAVCLVGVEKLSQPAETAVTSTAAAAMN